MQINLGEGTTLEGWSGRELVLDRQKCLRVGLRRMRQSFAMCPDMSFMDRLSGYTTGRCTEDDDYAHRRMKRALQWWASHPLDEVKIKQSLQAMAP
jgi:hypothetical protein